MKSPALLFLLLIVSSCGLGSTKYVWDEAGTSVSILDIDGNAQMRVARAARASDPRGDVDESNKVYFRSSDIEFWSIASISQIDDLCSTKFAAGKGYDDGMSLEFDLGDLEESVVFYPDATFLNDLSEQGTNPDWRASVDAFRAADLFTGQVNLVRLDIGNGEVVFIVDGVMRYVENAPAGGSNIDANSIVFADQAFLSAPVYVSRVSHDSIMADEMGAEALGVSAADFEFIRTVLRNSHIYDSASPIDLYGALFVPASPVDISAYDPDVDSLVVKVRWEMAGALYVEGSAYYMTDRVQGTCFDFTVELAVE